MQPAHRPERPLEGRSGGIFNGHRDAETRTMENGQSVRRKITREEKAWIHRRAHYLGKLFYDAFCAEMKRELEAGMLDCEKIDHWVPGDALGKLAVVRVSA